MSRWPMFFKSVWFYRRTYLGVLLGISLSCAILVGALSVGDSVKASLKHLSGERLGGIEMAMTPRERFVREALAADLAKSLATDVAGAIQSTGIVGTPDGSARLAGIRIYGVTPEFPAFGPLGTASEAWPAEGALINQRLARNLGIATGDTIVIRMEKPSLLPRDAVVNAVEDVQVSLRVMVAGILDSDHFGNFNLEVNQLPPENLFLPLAQLQDALEKPGKVNMLLVRKKQDQPLDLEQAEMAMTQHWQLEDAGIEVIDVPSQSAVEIRTGRIFFDPVMAEAATNLGGNPTKMLTYLVNSLEIGSRKTPYAMVTAIAFAKPPEGLPTNPKGDEVWLNQWTWDDLEPKVGDPLKMKFFAIDEAGKLVTREADFKVAGALPVEGPIDPQMMPPYPGLNESENCRDWDTGIPIDLEEIREKDEVYWDQYRGTPKALIALPRGQQIWDNRFGSLTAVRYPSNEFNKAGLAKQLRDQLNPAALGLFFNPVAELAKSATDASMDFSGLFIGFSFFIIIAALLLTALLMTFSLEQRASEAGTQMAVGLPYRKLRRQFIGEALLLCVPAAILGVILGWLFSKGILGGLTTMWQDAVGNWDLGYHLSPKAFVMGTAIGLLMALATIWPTLRRFKKVTLTQLLTGELRHETHRVRKRFPLALILAVLCLGGGIALVLTSLGQSSGHETGVFFGAGSLLLIGGLAVLAALLRRFAIQSGEKVPNQWGLAMQNLSRRRGRSLSISAMLACGAFLVFSLEAYRQDARVNADQRDSGTGGFAILAQSTIPLYRDLNLPANREQYGLDESLFKNVSVVPMRLLEGDDASCLNLNRAQQPRLLGIDPEPFAQRGAFSFKAGQKGKTSPWMALSEPLEQGEVPAIGDYNTLTYSLHLKVGDSLDYTGEGGESFKVRIVGALDNSLFQGSLLIHEDAFETHYPSQSGHRMFLIDAPGGTQSDLNKELNLILSDQGMRARPAVDVLNAYNQVQNTYISIFQVLGGLGLILGSLGMGVLVLRNILERRPELALFRAVGFRRRTISNMLVIEHGFLFMAGLICGIFASSVAILPKLMSPQGAVPWSTLISLVVILTLSGGFWTWLASRMALRGELVPALRKE